MSDLLTDEDIQTRHEPPKGWFNQFITIFERGCECAECGKSLSNKPGDIFFSCCPSVFATEAEARADADDVYSETDPALQLADHIGTFEL